MRVSTYSRGYRNDFKFEIGDLKLLSPEICQTRSGEGANEFCKPCAAPTGLGALRGRGPTASAVGYDVSSLSGLAWAMVFRPC